MFRLLAPWPNGVPDLSVQRVRARQVGISLLEVAMLMIIVTLALVPIIQHLGGPSSAQGNAVRAVGFQSKEILLGNTLIEQALANNFKTFNCGGAFNPATFPGQGLAANFPAST